MKFMLGSLLFAGGLIAQMAPVMATVPVSCAPGLPPVQSEGIQISGGVIELLDDACRPQQGSQIPLAMLVTNAAVTPSTVNAGQSTTYTANVANWIMQPDAGVTYDQCFLDVFRPGSILNESIPVTSLGAALSIPVTIPSGAVAGAWSVNLRCRRFVSGQEIILPSPTAVELQVQSTTVPTGCDNLQPPFLPGSVQSYASHYNAAFGESHNWVWNQIGNVYTYNTQSQTYDFQGPRVRAFSFVAPASGRSGKISLPSTTAGLTATISAQCGNFNLPAKCLTVASGAIQWSTEANPASFKCPLTPGQTYYLNFAWFDASIYINQGTVVSTCVCPGPNCNATSGIQFESSCAAGNNATQ